MTFSPSVSIVILNWNGKKYLEQFLPSVISTTYKYLKIVVADNASTDDSILFLKSNYPQIEILQLEKNYGFAKGYNEALRKVDGDYYVLLNSDVEVSPNWLEPTIELLEKDDRNAACQPKILSYQDKNLFEYAGAAGGWIDSFGYPFAKGRLFDVCEKDDGQYNKVSEIFWASGAALVIKANVFHEAGGFDEFFFAHQEEIDLCWRLQLMNYKIFCNPASIVYHVGGGTLPKGNSKKTYLNYRNNVIMLAKNLPFSELWWKIPFRTSLDQIAALKELLNGNGGYFIAVIKAHLAFVGWIFSKKKSQKLNYKKLNNLKGVYKGNIVWQYFIKKKKTFLELF